MIETSSVTFSYPGASEPALTRVSVRVEPGEFVGIVGPNGSGKSTLGRVLKGLLIPSQGQVHVDGLDPVTDGLAVRQRVGLVFQNPNSQIVNAVVDQEVAFGPENLGLPASEIRVRVDEALDAVGLADHKTAECHALTMADKQRVALASVIAMHPRYLILDESTAWLEPSARWALLGEIQRWCTERDVGLILVTHRMDEAHICTRLYGMLNGEVAMVGTPVEVLDNEDVRTRLALEVPEAIVLAGQLERAGLPVPTGAGIDALAETLCRS